MNKPRIVVTRKWPEPVEQELQKLFDVQLNADDKPMSVGELQMALSGADALCPTVSDKINLSASAARPSA